MPESITRPETTDITNTERTSGIAPSSTAVADAVSSSSPAPSAQIIWTPLFIILFALTLVIGLSADSLFAQAMLNNVFHILGWLLLGHTVLILGGWIVLFGSARSFWVRVGSIFGCIWSIFAGINYAASMFPLPLDTVFPLYLSAAANSALLGTYICLSIAHTPFRRWDSWFFRLAAPLGIIAVALTYWLLAVAMRIPTRLAITTSIVLLFASLFIWWLRPSCWHVHPGLTLLFGTTPLLLLITSIPSVITDGKAAFLVQVALLMLLLGVMRMIQGEKRTLT